VLASLKRWYHRTFRRPVEGDAQRAGQNVDAQSAATGTGSSQGDLGAAGVPTHGNIPPNYVPPADEGRPRH
jgi:hypothetical protein